MNNKIALGITEKYSPEEIEKLKKKSCVYIPRDALRFVERLNQKEKAIILDLIFNLNNLQDINNEFKEYLVTADIGRAEITAATWDIISSYIYDDFDKYLKKCQKNTENINQRWSNSKK